MDTRKRIIEMLGDRADLAIVNRHNLLIPLQLTDRGDDRRCTAAEGLLELAASAASATSSMESLRSLTL